MQPGAASPYVLLIFVKKGGRMNNSQHYLSKWVTECDIGDLHVSFLDTNEKREYAQNLPHFHSAFELQYISKGSMKLKSNNSTFTVSDGELVIIPPNFFHRTIPSSDIERYAILFTLSPIKKAEQEFSEYEHYSAIFENITSCFMARDADITYIMEKVSALSLYPGVEHRLKVLFSMLFITLSDKIEQVFPISNSKNKKYGKGKNSKAALRGLIDDYISLNYAEDGLIDKISDILHMSRRNTARVVNELYGASLSEVIIVQRMNCALGLIKESGMPLSEIAERVGYNSYSAFYKAFVKYYGASPDTFRA